MLQTWQVIRCLSKVHHIEPSCFEVVPITTLGDKVQDKPLNSIGGKGVFTKEIENALYDDRIDLAVHSMKDVPTIVEDAFTFPCYLERANPCDAFISLQASRIEDLPLNSHVGTSSIRRQAYVQTIRPDIRISCLRGNVTTRLHKLEHGLFDATFLACAGVERLGLNENSWFHPIAPSELIPAPAQGIIGVECLKDRADINEPINHSTTALQACAERAFLKALDGSCHTAIGCYTTYTGDTLILSGCLFKDKCYTVMAQDIVLNGAQAEHMAYQAAHNLS